jgi:hypothetical protein
LHASYDVFVGKGTNSRLPFTLGGPEFIVAIEDERFDELAARFSAAVRVLGDAPVVVVRASDVDDPNKDADLYIGAYVPTTRDCHKVLEYVSGRSFGLFEQDRSSGAVYRSGRLVWPSAPVAVTNLRGGSQIEVGTDAALLFMQGPQIRITTIPDVLLVVRPFMIRMLEPNEGLPADWIDLARNALAGRGRSPRKS